MKKHISFLLASIFLLFTLSSCSTSKLQGNEPEQVVDDALSALQTYDAETLVRCFGGDILGPDVLPPSLSKVYQSAFTKMDYEILGSKVDDDTATVTVKITVIDLDAVTLSIKENIAATTPESVASGTVYDLVTPVDLYQPYFDDPNVPMLTDTVAIPLVLVEGEWLILFDEGYVSVLFGVTSLT